MYGSGCQFDDGKFHGGLDFDNFLLLNACLGVGGVEICKRGLSLLVANCQDEASLKKAGVQNRRH